VKKDGYITQCVKYGLGQGLLTGKIGPDRIFSEGDQRSHKLRFSTENRQRIQKMLTTFQSVADKHSISLGQLAIGWTISQKGCTHALVGARTVDQALENAKGGNVKLDIEDLEIMSRFIYEAGADIL
jgi:aryl-alcohol dehydrogenase-like predicted oxidoreductase